MENNNLVSRKFVYSFSITALTLAVIFIIFPQIDLYASSFFYTKEEGFFLDEHFIFMFLHNSVTYITISFATLWISLIVLTYIYKKPIWGLSRIRIIYLLIALIAGPGIVVNVILKDNWGRARPAQTENFLGDKKFTPAFIIADQCKRNCSFVSGDPSVGFYIIALGFIIRNKRKIFYSTGISLGIIFGFTRIVQGKHFLSDVIFSGVFTFITVYLLYLVLLRLEARK